MVKEFYRQLHQSISTDNEAVLMVVIDSNGSSPGRKGFKMFVTQKTMYGSIGGGMMEFKMAELAKDLLKKGSFDPFIKRQLHHAEAVKDKSGMICSGEQVIAFYNITSEDTYQLNNLLNVPDISVRYTQNGIDIVNENIDSFFIEIKDNNIWMFKEPAYPKNKVYIIGGGHVSLALSEVLSRIDFEIHLIDDRPDLNTTEKNDFVHFKHIVSYTEIEKHIPEGNNIYVVIMSFGYRSDEIIVKRLIDKKFKFIGLMGSKEKIRVLFNNLHQEGYKKEDTDKIQAPIGIDIKSETTQEIAISVAAQLISYKNKY